MLDLKNNEDLLLSANVLIADDDPAVLRLLTHILEREGHRVRTALDGNQCLQMVMEDCPDILITDWVMPGIDGLELCRRMRSLHSFKALPHYTYILLLTSRSGKSYLFEGLEAGADDFVEKSVDNLTDLRVEIKARFKAALRTRKLELGLEFAAKYDSLTHLLNRLTFFEMAQAIWKRSTDHKLPLSAIMFDCDFFKRVNDIHGHLAGDAVLREMARMLKELSRTSDLLCRYGGEEFCVLLPSCNEKTAWTWAERIRHHFEATPVLHEKKSIRFTASFGVAERLEDTASIDDLIEKADQALLFAKESGRNRCIRFSDTIASESEMISHSSVINDLFSGMTAGDAMIPFSLTINQQETVAFVVDFFLRTHIDSVPVVDNNGYLLGLVSEKTFIPLIGNLERWQEPIGDLVSPCVVSFPVTTPLKIVYDFLCRVSVRQVLLLEENMPIGYINRAPLLRWLRNRWAAISGEVAQIIPDHTAQNTILTDWHTVLKQLEQEMNELGDLMRSDIQEDAEDIDRDRLISLISRNQDLMDQVLRLCSSTAEDRTGFFSQRGLM